MLQGVPVVPWGRLRRCCLLKTLAPAHPLKAAALEDGSAATSLAAMDEAVWLVWRGLITHC